MGEWTPAGGLNISDQYAFSHGRPPNITLRVMSRIEHPFVMNTTAKDGNERFEVRKLSEVWHNLNGHPVQTSPLTVTPSGQQKSVTVSGVSL